MNPRPTQADLERGIVRVRDRWGATKGAGFVLTQDGLLVTCAHVVDEIVGAPGESVRVAFYDGTEMDADVETEGWVAANREDIAFLRTRALLPDGVLALPSGHGSEAPGDNYATLGFPEVEEQSHLVAKGEIIDLVPQAGHPRLQVERSRIVPGFSGAPLWDLNRNLVVGMVESRRLLDADHMDPDVAYAIPVEALVAARPILNRLLQPPLILDPDDIPAVPPDVPHLRTLIGREREKQVLLRHYKDVADSGKGKTIFLLGAVGSGRRALVQWLQQEVHEQGGAVAATRFWDPRLLPEEETARLYWETPALQRYGATLAEDFTQLDNILPRKEAWLNLAAQLTRQSDPRDVTHPDWPDTPLTLARFVRRAARRRPLLLTVEYLDWVDSLWIDLLCRLADEIAQDLPVLLVVTLRAQRPLDRLSKDQHTEPTRLVETLEKARLASWHYLALATYDDIAAHLAPIDPAVVERLYTLSGGDPLVVQMLWDEWVAQKAVSRRWDGGWDVNYDGAGDWWVFGDARDHARALLEKGKRSGGAPSSKF